MNYRRTLQGINKDINQPITIKAQWMQKKLKAGKIRVIIIQEDMSGDEFFVKLGESYFITIKERKYILVSKCILNLEYPTIVYYYNNPLPLLFEYQISKLKALDLIDRETLEKMTPEQLSIVTRLSHDSETLDVAFNSTVLKNLYSESNSFFTTKNLLIIGGALLVVALIILQVTGRVDIIGGLLKFTAQMK